MSYITTLLNSKVLPRALIDYFNRPNNTLTMGKADSGQHYTPAIGVWGIEDGAAYTVTDGQSDFILVDQASGPYAYISCSIVGVYSTIDNRRTPCIVFKAVNKDTFMYMRLQVGAFEVWRSVNASLQMVASFPAVGLTDGQYYNLAVKCLAAELTFYLDGIQVGTYSLGDSQTDVSFISNTRVGMRLVKSGTTAIQARWRNLCVIPLDPQPLTAYDSFNRENGPVGVAPDTGRPWKTAGGNVWVIDDNKLRPTGSVVGVVTQECRADGEIEVKLTLDTFEGIAFRLQDENNFMYARLSTNLSVGKRIDSGFSIVGASYNFTPVKGREYHLRVLFIGSTIVAFLDGVMRISASDTSLINNTECGLFSSNGSKGSFDEFKMTGM